MRNLSVGRYVETHSFIHQLDPRTKLLGIIIFVAFLIQATHWGHYVVLTLYTFLSILLTKIPVLFFLKGIRPLLKIIIFTAMLQVLFSRGGTVYWQWGPFTLSEVGTRDSIVTFIRFSLIVMMTSVIGLSTKPLDLTAGVSWLLTPLRIIGFKVQNFAFMMSISFRFIPTLFDEMDRLRKAQESRGVQFDEGNFIDRMKKLLPLFIPTFVGSFYRAQELANTLDVRGYDTSINRTKYRIMAFSLKDAVSGISLSFLWISYLVF